jgi:hypothetical protein
MKNRDNNKSVLLAVVLIAFGGFFLMDNFHFLNFHFPVEILSWKLIFVFFAISSFAKGRFFGGAIWSFVAFYFYNPSILNQFNVSSIFELWPILLIGAGVDMIIKADRKRKFSEC